MSTQASSYALIFLTSTDDRELYKYIEPSEEPEASFSPSKLKLHLIGNPDTPWLSYLLYLSSLKGGFEEKMYNSHLIGPQNRDRMDGT